MCIRDRSFPVFSATEIHHFLQFLGNFDFCQNKYHNIYIAMFMFYETFYWPIGSIPDSDILYRAHKLVIIIFFTDLCFIPSFKSV